MSDLVLEDWDVDYSIGEGWFEFAWTDTTFVRVYVTLDFDTECEWKYFNGRDYEDCYAVAKIHSWEAWDYKYTNGDPEPIGLTDDLWPEDEKAMQAVIDEEYPKYIEEMNDVY